MKWKESLGMLVRRSSLWRRSVAFSCVFLLVFFQCRSGGGAAARVFLFSSHRLFRVMRGFYVNSTREEAVMKLVKSLVCMGMIGFSAGSIANAYAADGAALYASKGCPACHGADAKTPMTPAYPKLAGQSAGYLAQQVMDIRDGKRTNGQTAMMKPMTTGLSNEDIKAIADWLSALN
jgi:cytochrome c